MVELGKLILTHHPSFSITILILTTPNNDPNGCDATNQYIASISAAEPSITFHHIPPASLPTTLPSHILTLELCRCSNQHVSHFLRSISRTSNLKAIVMDIFNHTATRVTAALNIPTYFYNTSGASALAVLLQMPTIHQSTTKSFKDLRMDLNIPGLPRIPSEDLPDEVMDRSSRSYQVYIDIATSMCESDGIIINTSDAFEGRAIHALNAGLGLPEGTTPPVFCIGPVISAPCRGHEKRCLTWLDSQPSQSVVLLSFGSLGKFSRSQLMEIAIGLEKSEQRFLWVVRSESDGENSEELSLEELLPEGFLERTEEKGLVVRNWAPQAAILNHDSVGGFVTHCGWNSVLEAACEGVPMVAWPLYAEQKINKVILVQEMKVALALNKSKDGLVSGNELGDRIKELMDSDKGKEIRQRVFKMKIKAMEAVSEDGSSIISLNKLAELWKEQPCVF